ncbi:hypothetical protein CYMTET_42466 [Cymbomonas tetramitiformis]|uniref:Uncharacterized protein n=1 Tax=Cymbomonas tetramitiformis TaxID=36881 RepID=A0AAE0C556_9CHLO|nr:hypothetical protein CYMTET_42466 [Cymbomonas tetramitiformis]
MEVLEVAVAGFAKGQVDLDWVVKLSMFGSLISLEWVGMEARWWLRRFVPWWNELKAGELAAWFSGGARFGTYVLASQMTGRTYVGKFWGGPEERLRAHFRALVDTDRKGGKRLYGTWRSRGMHTLFMLPLRTYTSKGDCDADEKLIIRRTQRAENSLNTIGVRRRDGRGRRKGRAELVRHVRRRGRNMRERARGAVCGQRKYGKVTVQGYNGGALDQALRRLCKGQQVAAGEWVVDHSPGCWSYTDWTAVKLQYGQSRLRLSNSERTLSGTLRQLLPVLKKENAKLRFSKIVKSDKDFWAREMLKKLVRRPRNWKVIPKLTLDRVVRLWRAAPNVVNAAHLARCRAALGGVARKVHDFAIKHVYLCRVSLPVEVPTALVLEVALRCVNAKYPVGATRSFVRERTRVVRVAQAKVLDLFTNLNRSTLCIDVDAECRCGELPEDLPRRGGHVCFRTTELTGNFEQLNCSLKTAVWEDRERNADGILQSVSEFVRQFRRHSAIGDNALQQLLPWKGSIQEEWVTAVLDVTDEKLFVALCGTRGLIVQVLWDRFVFLIQRVDAFATARGRKLPLISILREVLERLYAWSKLITQDYWITPYSKQDALRFCFSLCDELFASPLDVNCNSRMFCTPYPVDAVFGAVENAYRILWHVCALGNPIYTLAHIRKCLTHAVLSAKTSRLPVRIAFIVPYWRKWDEMEGVELVGLLTKGKFSFLAPQSALGFKDRSKAARFEVAILLIQNQAAAKTKPVTRQGLARVERAFADAVDDRGICYSSSWGVGFSWQLAREVRAWMKTDARERHTFARFRALMDGDVSAGLLLQKYGGALLGSLGRAQACGSRGMLTVSVVKGMVGKMNGLVRGVLDRNVAVGFGVCQKVYRQWLEDERDSGNYELVEEEQPSVVQCLYRKFLAAGLKGSSHFNLGGTFGNLYVLPKHKDVTLLEKRRPVVPCFASPDRMLQNRLGRALCFFISSLEGHFNVAATQEIVPKLQGFNAELGRDEVVMAAGFDVKEMYVRLRHTQVLRAVEYVVQQELSARGALLVSTRGRKGVKWYTPGTPRRTAVKITSAQVLAATQFVLEGTYLTVAGSLVRQVCGIGIGGGASPGLAQCVCVFGELEWVRSLRADARLLGVTLLGVRLMDDCLLIAKRRGDGEGQWTTVLSRIFAGYLRDCYPDGVTVEQTSESLEWVFCGMKVCVSSSYGVSARMIMKNVEAGVGSGDAFVFFPMVAYSSACSKTQKMACTLNALYI